MKKIFLNFCLFLFFSSVIFAEYNSRGIQDSADIRKDIIESWFEASIDELREKIPEIRANGAGQKFKIYFEEADSYYCIYVASGKSMDVNVFSEGALVKEQQIVYPGNLPGTWVLIKDKATDKPLRIRYFFTGDSDVFVQVSPYGKVAAADLVIFGEYAAKGVSTGVPFSQFYSASFDDLMSLTKKSIPWNYVLIDSSYYHGVHFMIQAIKNNLPRVVITDDAMYDENNSLISIASGTPMYEPEENSNKLFLSSAGFAKWIADGLVFPVSGGLLKRSPLIVQTVSVKDTGVQGIRSQSYSLFFSLDWIRNLASAVVSVYSGRKYVYPESGVDVTINPFASSLVPGNGTANTVSFIPDSGYRTTILKSLLYVLAATEPDTFYLGAIRETDKTITPELKTFNRCVIFFPYFKTDNTFDCKVFIEGRMLSLSDFYLNYPEDFVYLTRMRSSENFVLK